MKKYSKVLAVLLVVAILIPGIGAVVEAAPNDAVTRFAGSTREGTAVEASKEMYQDGSDAVVLAGYNGTVDALTGTLLADKKDAPVLITRRDNLSYVTAKEIERLSPSTIYIVGGNNSVSDQVKAELSEDYTVERVYGSKREDTAIEIAKEAKGTKSHVFLTKGYDKPGAALADALAVGPVSAIKDMPVLLTKTDEIPEATVKAMKDFEVTDVTIVGGTSAVSQDIEDELDEKYKVNRVIGEPGSGRQGTALAVAKKYFTNPTEAVVAYGWKDADALVGGYVGAKQGAPILLSKLNLINKAAEDYIAENIKHAYILGGTKAISSSIEAKISEAVKVEVDEDITVTEKLVKQQINTNLEFMHKTVDNPSFGTLAGEWTILSLARGGYDTPKEYYDLYESNVKEEVKRLMEKNPIGKLHRAKGTEHSRLILGFTALGKDITDVAGYDIREGLVDFDFATKQGINGPIFALIALDSNNYELPKVSGVENESTREKFIEYILDREIKGENGELSGWSLGGTKPDPDITGMAIQGLTPYYNEREDVKEAVDRGVAWLSEAQSNDGGYHSGFGGENIESASQVVVALTGLGIDPHNDRRFIKNGNSIIDNLLTFAVEDGGFMHVKPGSDTGGGAAAGVVDGMATDQGTYALIAYDRFINNQNSLYDMTDVNK